MLPARGFFFVLTNTLTKHYSLVSLPWGRSARPGCIELTASTALAALPQPASRWLYPLPRGCCLPPALPWLGWPSTTGLCLQCKLYLWLCCIGCIVYDLGIQNAGELIYHLTTRTMKQSKQCIKLLTIKIQPSLFLTFKVYS